MKKVLLLILTLLLPIAARASRPVGQMAKPELDVPYEFSTSGETRRIEYGCPISNEVIEGTKKAVLNQLISECAEQIKTEAQSKPEVVAVIQTSLIAPNVTFQQTNGKQQVNGTLFFEAAVLIKPTR